MGVSSQSWRLLDPGRAEACQGPSVERFSMNTRAWTLLPGAEMQEGEETRLHPWGRCAPEVLAHLGWGSPRSRGLEHLGLGRQEAA